MGYKIINETSLTNIANAIRTKSGQVGNMSPAQMVTNINNYWLKPTNKDVVVYEGQLASYTNLIGKFHPIKNMVAGTQYDYTIDITTDANTTAVGLFVSQGEGDAFVWLNITAGTRQTLTGTFTCSYETGYTPTDDAKNADIMIYQYPRNIDGLTIVHSLVIQPHISL